MLVRVRPDHAARQHVARPRTPPRLPFFGPRRGRGRRGWRGGGAAAAREQVLADEHYVPLVCGRVRRPSCGREGGVRGRRLGHVPRGARCFPARGGGAGRLSARRRALGCGGQPAPRLQLPAAQPAGARAVGAGVPPHGRRGHRPSVVPHARDDRRAQHRSRGARDHAGPQHGRQGPVRGAATDGHLQHHPVQARAHRRRHRRPDPRQPRPHRDQGGEEDGGGAAVLQGEVPAVTLLAGNVHEWRLCPPEICICVFGATSEQDILVSARGLALRLVAALWGIRSGTWSSHAYSWIA
mmetsp:Transcript_21402/g.68161  ORF Transcript_21402/g.68161 Transcript_21402/m.68161 type:complete len:296 (-) Transcript_21402:47-934(-)